MRRAALVDDNGPVLQPLHPVLHAVRPLHGLLGPDALTAVVRDALGVGAVADGLHVVVPVLQDPPGALLVRDPVAEVLVDQIDRLPRLVIVQPDKGVRVREPSPVHPLKDMVEPAQLLIRDDPQLQVLEHASAGPHRHPQILVLIPALIPLPQALGLLIKGLAQPLRVVQIQIRAPVLEAVFLLLLAVLVGPVVLRPGRVVGLEVPEHRPAAHRALQDAVDLCPARELVLLLKMRDPDIPEFHLDAFDLHRVVRAPEQDLLPGGQIDELERGFPRLPELAHPQLLDGPPVLAVDRVPQRVAHLPQDQRVNVRVLHDQADDGEGGPAGLPAAAAAAGLIVGVAVLERIHADGAEARIDILQVMRPGKSQRPVIGAGEILERLPLDAVHHLFPLFDGGDIPASCLVIQTGGNHGIVLNDLVRNAELGQDLPLFVILHRGGANLAHIFRNRLPAPIGFRRCIPAFPPVFSRGFRCKLRCLSFFQVVQLGLRFPSLHAFTSFVFCGSIAERGASASAGKCRNFRKKSAVLRRFVRDFQKQPAFPQRAAVHLPHIRLREADVGRDLLP